jgi:hypothetical protein
VTQGHGTQPHAVTKQGTTGFLTNDRGRDENSELTITHKTDIAEPITLYVRDDKKIPHVVLLLPSGAGLEAIWSYDGSRARGLRTFQLTPIQIQRALGAKLKK